MKCSIMLHFIWFFTVCKSTRLGVSSIQRVKEYLLTTCLLPNDGVLDSSKDSVRVKDSIIKNKTFAFILNYMCLLQNILKERRSATK